MPVDVRSHRWWRSPVFWVLTLCLAVCIPLQVRDLAWQEPQGDVLAVSLCVGAVELLAFWGLAALVTWILERVRTRPGVPASAQATPGGNGGDPALTAPRMSRRPLALRVLALLWGLSVVPVIASFANTLYFGVLNGLGLHAFAASIAAPIDEDLLRFVGTLGVLALVPVLGQAPGRTLTIGDGLLYGFLVGAGFEVAENLAFLVSSTDVGSTLQLALLRFGIGFGLHALWTGIAGAALAHVLARLQAGQSAQWSVLVAGLALPMLFHAAWDAPSVSISPAVVFGMLWVTYGLTLAAFVGCVLWARRGYARRA